MRGIARRYRSALQTAVSGSAAPYGYTLTIWTSGAVVMQGRGLPTTADVALFVAGAIAGFITLGVLAFGGIRRHLTSTPSRASLWSAFHLGSVGVAGTAAGLAGHYLEHAAAWPLAGFVATCLYLAVYALQALLAGANGDGK